MDSANPPLPTGYSPVPAGKIANVVTCLEMRAPPPRRPARPLETPLMLDRWTTPDLDAYRALFRAVGQDWLWFSRLFTPDARLAAVLADPGVEVYRLMEGRKVAGLLELDFRKAEEAEIAYFGLVPEAIGRGAGRFMMDGALAIAWGRPVRRVWVHTCTFGHPGAPAFYQRSGFRPYAFMVEVSDDPRLTGHLPREAAPHVPLVLP